MLGMFVLRGISCHGICVLGSVLRNAALVRFANVHTALGCIPNVSCAKCYDLEYVVVGFICLIHMSVLLHLFVAGACCGFVVAAGVCLRIWCLWDLSRGGILGILCSACG